MAANGVVSGAGAGHLLLDLPSRGYFSSSTASAALSAPVGLRLYVCDHETSPPDEQIIKTDPTNILIRSLTIKKAKGDLKAKEKPKSGADSSKGKRPAERATDDKSLAKRANTGSGTSSSRKEGGGASSLSEKDIQGCTVEKLRSMLKERNLPRTGKKEELIARLKQSMTL